METETSPNTSLKELMAEKLGGGKGKKKKAKLHMHIRPTDDKRFIVEHSYRGGSEPTPESTEHAPADLAALHKHLDEHYSDEPDSSEAAPAPENV